MARFPWQKQEVEGKEPEFTLPDELQKKIDAGAAAAAELPKMTQVLNDLKSIMETSTKSAKEREDAAAAAAARKQNEEQAGTLEERIESLMLEGKTKDAVSLATQPLATELLLLRFNQTKNEVFSDEDAFEFYHGDIKKEVDRLLEGQSLQFKADPAHARENIKNCYDTVVGRHHKEILEGKLKNRFASSESSARGTASGSAGNSGAAGEGKRAPVQDLEEIKKAARLLGFKTDDYIKLLDEEGIGYA